MTTSQPYAAAGRWCLLAAVICLALLVRLPRLSQRPMHTDEAVNAYIAGQVLDGEHFRYDPRDRHGPALPALAWLTVRAAGARHFSELSESMLRMVPVTAGVLTALGLAAGSRRFGLLAAGTAAGLWVMAPLPAYYNRYYIHESLFVAATLGTMVFGWRTLEPRRAPNHAARQQAFDAAAAGFFAALMLACKVTALLHFAAFAVAACWWRIARRGQPEPAGTCSGFVSSLAGRGLIALVVFVAVSVVFYSWFGWHWQGPLDLLRSVPRFLARASGEGHEKSVLYYALLLAGGWSGPCVLALAAWGVFVGADVRRLAKKKAVVSLLTSAPTVRKDDTHSELGALLVYTVVIAALYSFIPYKTPWLALNLWLPLCLLAGFGMATLWQSVGRESTRAALADLSVIGQERARSASADTVRAEQAFSRLRRRSGFVAANALMVLFVLAMMALLAALGRDTWQRVFALPADERNPYAYAHTSDDLLSLPDRVRQFAARNGGGPVRIAVVAADPWPLPWYLRRFPNTGYWQPGQDPGPADLFITSAEAAGSSPARWAGRRPEFFGVRPGVLIILWTPSPEANRAGKRRDSKRWANECVVAQVFNLLYRRVTLGRPVTRPNSTSNAGRRRTGVLRYGRVQLCVTPADLPHRLESHE